MLSETLSGFTVENLQYNPMQREQVWRFFSYMFAHGDILHLASNLFVQIFLGIPLEYQHSWWRVMIVYLAGVLSGSLGASIMNPMYPLIGASAGGYALLFAYIPTFILNWREMKDRFIYFLVFFVFFTSITLPSFRSTSENVSHTSHACGAAAGILVGMIALKNIKVEDFERKLQVIAAALFSGFVLSSILFHIFYGEHFPMKV